MSLFYYLQLLGLSHLRLGWGICISDHLFSAFITNHPSSQTLELRKCRDPKLPAVVSTEDLLRSSVFACASCGPRWWKHASVGSTSVTKAARCPPPSSRRTGQQEVARTREGASGQTPRVLDAGLR